MEIYRGNYNIPKNEKLVFTLGMFDGVHLGHQSVLNYIKNIAKEEKGKTAVMTFSPHPRLVLNPEADFRLLTILDEKISLFEKFSVDYLFIQEFSKEFSQLSSEEFIQNILVNQLNIHALVIGYDQHFGKNRELNYENLKIQSKKLDFKLYQLPAVSENQEIISSTKIRNKLLKGSISEANEWLGYPFILSGKVIEGDKIGRTLGFPTANLEIDPHKIHPTHGVYFVKVKIDNNQFYGMMNIGMRPTVNGVKKQVEVHILNFDQDIYGKIIEVSFYERVRNEIKFSSLDELKNRLSIDKMETIKFFNL
ncbi:bifunctional riboflavin kinase/FAD synthetase [Apibacter muscae]|uniref:bifunctional riboflavin kinase/FAD synthetase n=1 Tax=Apibacter muscae TaxID=2509004 RepID=UPI001FEB42DE|nr:bifunctional riboflavin kinase/FAD synthetase [Apibacter muscae]